MANTLLRLDDVEIVKQPDTIRVPFTLKTEYYNHVEELATKMGTTKSKIVDALIKMDIEEAQFQADQEKNKAKTKK